MAAEQERTGEPIDGPSVHFVEVHFDPVDVGLLVEEPRLAVRPGDRVWWIFRGVPDGWTPWIDVEGPSDPRPFEEISQSPWAVRGTVSAAAEQGVVGYRATLQRGLGRHHPSAGALLSSAVAELVVQPAVEPRLHEVQATYVPPEDSSSLGSVEVEPELTKIGPADSIVWTFDVPEGTGIAPGSWRPRVDFVRFEGVAGGPDEPPNLPLGPFSTLTTRGNQVTGAGDSRAPGIYNYMCLIVGRVAGNVLSVSSPDPAVDKQGDPPG